LKRRLDQVARYYHQEAKGRNKADADNWAVIPLISDATRQIGSSVQSLHVRQGTALENIATVLIDKKEGHHRPQDLFGPGASADDKLELPSRYGATYADGSKQSVIWSRLPKNRVVDLANEIKERFTSLPPEEKTFAALNEMINSAVAELRAIDPSEYEAKPKGYVIDIADEISDSRGRRRELQLIEMKSSGKLDSNNVKHALSNVLKARLALLDHPCRIKVYAAQAFEGINPNTSLSKTFPKELFKAGADFWEPLLEDGLAYDDLKKAWASACKPYRLSTNPDLLTEAFADMSEEQQEQLLTQLLRQRKSAKKK